MNQLPISINTEVIGLHFRSRSVDKLLVTAFVTICFTTSRLLATQAEEKQNVRTDYHSSIYCKKIRIVVTVIECIPSNGSKQFIYTLIIGRK